MTEAEPSVRHFLPVTVVIPSLGGATLGQTIQGLNAGIYRPAEIIACVPEDAQMPTYFDGVQNLSVLRLPFRGQVKQRAAGFAAARQSFVLQLDDDLEFSSDGLRRLIDSLRALGPGNAVGPVLVVSGSEEPWAPRASGYLSLLQDAVVGLLHGPPFGRRRMGRIGRTGWNFAVDHRFVEEPLFSVDWLPGGCVLHFRDSVILEDYFPFSGKAYGEDLLMSQILRRRGIKLWVVPSSRCGVEPVPSSGAPPVRFQRLLQRLKVRDYINRHEGIGLGWRLVAVAYDLVASVAAIILRRDYRRSRPCEAQMSRAHTLGQ